MWNWWKHAFAVEPAGIPRPTPAEAELVDRLARAVVRRGLATPALFMLDSSHPLNFLGAQAMLFFEPIVKVLFRGTDYTTLARYLERRGSIEYVCRRIEDMQAAPAADAADSTPRDGPPADSHA